MTMGGGSGIDSRAIRDSVRTFERRLGDCISQVGYRNSNDGQYDEVPVSPREARLTIAPGVQSNGGYFDVRWWQNGDYKYHYEEDGLLFRFGREVANRDLSKPVNHFHPPSDPAQHSPSCIPPDHEPELVTLAVIANWYVAAQEGDPERLNTLTNPP